MIIIDTLQSIQRGTYYVEVESGKHHELIVVLTDMREALNWAKKHAEAHIKNKNNEYYSEYEHGCVKVYSGKKPTYRNGKTNAFPIYGAEF